MISAPGVMDVSASWAWANLHRSTEGPTQPYSGIILHQILDQRGKKIDPRVPTSAHRRSQRSLVTSRSDLLVPSPSCPLSFSFSSCFPVFSPLVYRTTAATDHCQRILYPHRWVCLSHYVPYLAPPTCTTKEGTNVLMTE